MVSIDFTGVDIVNRLLFFCGELKFPILFSGELPSLRLGTVPEVVLEYIELRLSAESPEAVLIGATDSCCGTSDGKSNP